VSNILAQSLSIDELLGEVIDQIFDLLKRIDRGAILLLNKETGKLRQVVSKTRMEDKDGIFSKINYSKTVVNRAIKEGKPVMMSDTSRADKADLSASMKQMNIRSVMCVPLTYKGDVKGVIYVDSLGSPEGFRKDDLQVLAALSNTAAIAIENARLYEEVKQELAERKRAEEALKESSEKIRLFAYSVSHDLKSPAVSIYGLTRLLSKHYRDIVDEKGRNYCDQILKASEQIAALVEQINVFISSKENPLKIEPVNMKEILQMVREEYSAQINIRRIRWLEPESTPEIKVDRLSILRIIRNLIDNALKYGGDDLSEIRIGHKESDKFHIVSVSDDGVGLKREESEKIFELFQRHETSIGVQGAGLGLAIVKEITEHHGGRVWAEPGPKKGMTFYVSISRYL